VFKKLAWQRVNVVLHQILVWKTHTHTLSFLHIIATALQYGMLNYTPTVKYTENFTLDTSLFFTALHANMNLEHVLNMLW
jgi:hypothetical protein